MFGQFWSQPQTFIPIKIQGVDNDAGEQQAQASDAGEQQQAAHSGAVDHQLTVSDAGEQ